jgi:hypothetical protein
LDIIRPIYQRGIVVRFHSELGIPVFEDSLALFDARAETTG